MDEEREQGQGAVAVPKGAWRRLVQLDQEVAQARGQLSLAVEVIADTLGLDLAEWRLDTGQRAFVRKGARGEGQDVISGERGGADA